MRCFPCYPQAYCTTTSFPYQDFGIILQVHFENSWHPGYDNFLFLALFNLT